MGAQATVLKTVGRFKAGSKGVLGTAASGIGTDLLMRTVDNVVGSPVQRIFSFNLPVVGTVGPIDALNYILHAGGIKVSKNGIIAIVSAKIVAGALPSIGPIQLPGSPVAATGVTKATGQESGGARF